MGDITRRYFLDRDFTGPEPYRGRNHLPVPSHPTELLLEGFHPREGPKLQALVTGKWPTGEPKPRKLPDAVMHEVAHLINEHRHRARVGPTGYVIQLVATGEPRVHWTLEIASGKAGRYDPMHSPAAAEAKARHAKGLPAVFKSELDNLFIRHWLRRIHYTVNVIAFDSVGDMDVWLQRFGPSTLATKDLHRQEPVQEPREPTPWFELHGWQRLPDELIARFDSGAMWLVFPDEADMLGRAVKAAPGPLLVQPFTLLWEAMKEHGERGPKGCVHTLFQADLRVVFSLGQA
jgi:hypothetical protein